MSRYAQTLPNDQSTAIEGDARFVGVNAKDAPLLESGLVADAVNLRFAEGQAITREGLITPPSHRWTANTGEHVVRGSEVWSDPNGTEWLLLATPRAVVQLRAGHSPRTLRVPEEIASPVQFVQAFAGMLMFRGSRLVPWEWSGAGAWSAISQADLGDGTVPIPNGPDRIGLRPVILDDRLYVPHGRSELAASDLLGFTRYDAAFYDYNIAGGNDDVLTGLLPFRGSNLLAFNDGSIQLLSGLTGDLSAARKDPVNPDLGCLAGGTIAMVGGDVFFLSGTGVYRVTQVIQDKLETSPVAVSEPIAPVLARVNWSAATGAVAAVHGRYYYLAVPLDGSTSNNAILPYNTVTQAWEGVHLFPAGVRFDALHVTDYFGAKALYGVDYASGLVHLLYHGWGEDRIGETAHAIETTLTTRGYTLGSNDSKRFNAAQMTVQTWHPGVSVDVATDGQEETTALVSGWTRSRTKRMVHGAAAIDATNVNNDHATPRREDYSVVAPFYTGSGIRLERMQTQPPQRWLLRERGRYAQLTISNTQGVIALTSTQLEGAATDTNTHPAP